MLSQKIPFQMGMLTQLSILDLRHNFFTRVIPSEFRTLQSLETLNLSHNKLSGFIPESLGKMPSSLRIDVHFNNLGGPTPNGRAFANVTIEQLKGNKYLCGNITGLQACQSQESRRRKNKVMEKVQKLVLIIVFSLLGSVVLLVVFIGTLRMYERRKNDKQVEGMDLRNGDMFSILTYDGKAVYKEILKATEEFNETFCIGEGGFGRVYKAMLPPHNRVAIKRLHLQSEMVDHIGFLNEIRVLTTIKHRNIVKLYGFCSNAQHSFLVYEYLQRGSLAKMLSIEEEAKQLDWEKRVNIIKGVAHALSYMHHDCSPPIVHRDICSNNVLLDSEYEARVSDFGTAKLLKKDSSNWSALAGTYGYIAPGNKSFSSISVTCYKSMGYPN